MPRTIDEGFRDFLKKLTPSSAESEAAKSHRASIEARLIMKGDFGLRRFTRIGSFGNGTSISGYSDVDYLASLARDTLTSDSTYSLGKVRNSLDDRFPKTGVSPERTRLSCTRPKSLLSSSTFLKAIKVKASACSPSGRGPSKVKRSVEQR